MRTSRIAAAGVMVLGGAAFAATAVNGASAQHVAPRIGVADFTNPVPNPYFPLVPGTVSRFKGSSDGEKLHERVTVTHGTKVIQGVVTTVIVDVLFRADGSVAEKTHDWYASDNGGNVWYFGEKTATYDKHGHVKSRDGSWQAGVNGAVAGTIMPANPHPTDAYRQEYYKGHAEDQAWIVQGNVHAKVAFGKLSNIVRSYEWTRLEPGVMSMKFYAPGLGIVREQDIAGGDEIFELVSVSHP